MVYVSRKEHFNAAHRLFNAAWTDEKNEEVFGKCSNEYYHGHNFEIIVTVKGNPNPETGFVIDMKVLGDIMKREIVELVDHKNINLQVEIFKNKIPSCEIMVIEFWNILEKELKKVSECKLHYIKLIETNKNFVEYYG
ncbi:MAG: 6-carboxytetrahydropterin synthase [Cytophagales bacterium]|nr:MAG: 6-carboxytetrahydropterin synthase [Cytophagales bacterium]TAH31120.1 MAG: 6-carboxytetrahydropterin synthase [Cytophagales bacterium]